MHVSAAEQPVSVLDRHAWQHSRRSVAHTAAHSHWWASPCQVKVPPTEVDEKDTESCIQASIDGVRVWPA